MKKPSFILLSEKNLTAIQNAEMAIQKAFTSVAVTVRLQAESCSSGNGLEFLDFQSEETIQRIKSLTRLSQGLVAVEVELRKLHDIAANLSIPASVANKTSPPALITHKISNDNKLLGYLRATLKADVWTTQTAVAMAVGAGLPPGSVSTSLQRLLASGVIKRALRSRPAMYRLGN